jgi:hypothetical protein
MLTHFRSDNQYRREHLQHRHKYVNLNEIVCEGGLNYSGLEYHPVAGSWRRSLFNGAVVSHAVGGWVGWLVSQSVT